MIAYKFLERGGIDPFGRQPWPLPSDDAPGAWVEIPGPLDPGSNGLHACTAAGLPRWLNEELFEVELADPVVAVDGVAVSDRGRLRRRIDRWNEQASDRFSTWCVFESVSATGALLRLEGLGVEAIELEQHREVEAVLAAATDLVGALGEEQADWLGYAADSARYALNHEPQVVSYIAAEATRTVWRHEGRLGDGYVEHRRRQAEWLCNRLEIASL